MENNVTRNHNDRWSDHHRHCSAETRYAGRPPASQRRGADTWRRGAVPNALALNRFQGRFRSTSYHNNKWRRFGSILLSLSVSFPVFFFKELKACAGFYRVLPGFNGSLTGFHLGSRRGKSKTRFPSSCQGSEEFLPGFYWVSLVRSRDDSRNGVSGAFYWLYRV